MAKGTLSGAASGNNNTNNELNSSIQSLEESIKSVLSQRFKNDPKKQNQEFAKYADLLAKGGEKAEKVKAALAKKSEAELRKEKRKAEAEATQTEIRLKMAATDDEIEKKRLANELANAQFKESMAEAADNVKENLSKAGAALNAAVDKGIDEYAAIFSKYAAGVEARLQTGALADAMRFDLMAGKVRTILAGSPFLKQEVMLDNLNELIQLGVNYNIEQRAFLQSMTDKLVTTFNAFDSNLLAIIRLQQADSTAARLGMEAILTKNLNSMFKDTSYLSDTFDTVSQTLFDTIALLGRDQGLEFEYTVQKWLGSLGAVGVGQNTLTKIAQGINYLGTGDVNALQSDTGLQNLMVMAANRSGLDYASLLTQGLNAQSANTLLRGVVDYVREISASDNAVVRKQYADLFGVSTSDMVAALNLNTSELDKVQKTMLSYNTAQAEAQKQLNTLVTRMHISEMIDNLFDNVMATTSANIAASAGGYMTWKAINQIEQLTGGIAIPAVSVMGNMVDLHATVEGLMKTGIAGLSMMGSLIASVGGLFTGGGTQLWAWGGDEYLRRGSGFGGVTSGYASTTSSSTAIVSSSGSDMADQAITAASEEGNEKIENEKSQETNTEKMLKKIMQAVAGTSELDGDGRNYVLVALGGGAQTGAGLAVRVINTDTDAIPVKGFGTGVY